MIITNKLGLPAPLVSMAQRDYEHKPNRYSVTSLLKGVREAILERRHYHEIEQDVSDMIWLLFGTAVHMAVEQYQESEHELKEERIETPFEEYVLSGRFDLYNAKDKEVTDYKTASVWKIIFGDYSDWRRQTLTYAYFLRQMGFEVNKGKIVAFLKDWSKRDAKIKPDYPPYPVHVVSFDFTESDFEEEELWLKERFAAIREAEKLPDDQLPVCTPEERYNSGDKYAVMKKGRKTAPRVLDSEEEAKAWMDANGGDYIEVRKGEDKKCMDYCSVCEFCSYYKQEVAR